MKQKDESKIILKQWIRVFLLIAVIAVAVVAIVSIVKSLNPEKLGRKELYSYTYNSNLDYKVYLKNNSFFTSPYIGPNKQYITSLIDYIDVDATYNFKSTKELDYSYNYEIGGHFSLAGGKIQMDAALFYMDIYDQQISKFVGSGLGRAMVNAGRGQSYGAEAALRGGWTY